MIMCGDDIDMGIKPGWILIIFHDILMEIDS